MTWLYVPGISSPCVQGSEDLNSASCSLSTIGERLAEASATWRGKEQQPQAWSRRWKQGGFIRHLSGLTCSPSTLNHGVAQFISSLRATPAKTTALPERAQGRTESDFSPLKSAASPKSAGLILSSARTSRGMRTDSLKLSSRHWSDWATSLRQEYSVRPPLATPCGASDCSSWPYDSEGRSSAAMPAHGQLQWPGPDATNRVRDEETLAKCAAFRKANANQNTVPLYLAEVAERWAGPKASDPEKAGPNMRGSKGDVPLPGQAANWHAPRANDAEKRGEIALDPRDGLVSQSEHWMGPNVPNGGRSTAHAELVGSTLYHEGKKVQLGLESQAKNWPGPSTGSNNSLRGGAQDPEKRRAGGHQVNLQDVAAFFRPPSSPALQIAGGSMSSTDFPNSNQPSVKRKLNPIFVEALMRWPTGLSGFERQETAWTRWWLLMPSFLSALVSASEDQQMDMFGAAA